LRERLAQLMMVRVGSNMPPVRTVEEDEARVAALLGDCPVGGLVMFNGSFAETPGTLERLQRASRYPLLVAADFERGAGQQLAGWPLFPHAMAFDALGARAADAVRRFGELTAAASRAAGVHIPFAPVADVNSDPRNPIIATRAFGSAPRRVAELAAAFVHGCRAGGALAAATHFPGHGNTQVDSHHALPTVAAARAELERRDLPPFRAAIAAGAPIVMTAHVAYPALDSTGAPATLSHAILTRLLREELGFDGAVVSDSFLMEGVKHGDGDDGRRAAVAIAAGVDMLVDLEDPVGTLDALAAAVAEGRLAESRVDEALARVGRLKQLMFDRRASSNDGAASIQPFDAEANRQQTASLALDVARGATVVLKNARALLPLDRHRSLGTIFVNPFPRPSNAPPLPLGELLRGAFPQLTLVELGAAPTPQELASAAQAVGKCEQLLVVFIVKPAAWHQFGLPGAIAAWLSDLCCRRATVAACLGAPQGLEFLAGAGVQLCTFSDVPASQQALVEKLVEQASA
jgi:beta-glucosidase-like glycosyl hydrolase